MPPDPFGRDFLTFLFDPNRNYRCETLEPWSDTAGLQEVKAGQHNNWKLEGDPPVGPWCSLSGVKLAAELDQCPVDSQPRRADYCRPNHKLS